MKKIITLLILCFSILLSGQSENKCTKESSIVEKGKYEVVYNDSLISRHNKYVKAAFKADSVSIANNGDIVDIYGTRTEVSSKLKNCDNSETEKDSTIVIPPELPTELKAFPSAYGGGAYASGGRGKPVYFVNNLNEFGSGSFRQVVEDSKLTDGGNIAFNVSGVFKMDHSWTIRDLKNVTFWGQSAPQGGVTITVDITKSSANKLWILDCDNLIFRYIKFRPTLPSSNDAVDIISSTNLIFDHCSISWGGDEGISTRVFGDGSGGWNPVNNITIQRCLIAESQSGSILGSSGSLESSDNISLHQNLYHNISKRFSNMTTSNRLDIINNVVYNWTSLLSNFNYSPKVNNINNYFKTGLLNFSVSEDGYSKPLHAMADGTVGAQIYAAGNYIDKDIFTDPNADNKQLFYRWSKPLDGYAMKTQVTDFSVFVDKPHSLIGAKLPIQSAIEVYNDVTTNVGANMYIDNNGNRVKESDALDNNFLNNVINDTPEKYRGVNGNDYNYQFTEHYTDFINSITGSPINTRPSDFDTNKDGIPNVLQHLLPEGKKASDIHESGYSYLEVILLNIIK